jgi:hypothetical protein
MNQYTEGTLLRLTAQITTVTGVLTDATTITARVQQPDGVILDISAEVIHDSIGNYHVDYLTEQVGLHQYMFHAEGNAQVSQVNKFIVYQGLF